MQKKMISLLLQALLPPGSLSPELALPPVLPVAGLLHDAQLSPLPPHPGGLRVEPPSLPETPIVLDPIPPLPHVCSKLSLPRPEHSAGLVVPHVPSSEPSLGDHLDSVQ